MRKYGFLTLFLLFCLCLSATEKKDFEKAVREAVSRQMQNYPKSTLKDLYKNFFQDKFGPGHIISDTTAAGNYLRRDWPLIRSVPERSRSRLGGKVTFFG